MKRIYVSFFTTITIALASTLVAFVERNKIESVVIMDNNPHALVQDSTFTQFTTAEGLFN
ncbi:hypothetical protein FRZ67_20015 [Panacibacter ginsenosidivorans]|uniref:Uncharacterized protein n=1 Tax=Panacibacter ginsenosidivorans TaxID=1813871 RepID=A0A5B8VEJ7_9BACT|nr:hypothetical protein [Panacibacter ginsenosidivorans]QEC69475.1 hypothetical protein FRZ67_20015 [Panacibacter ginsenosidivorans]